MILAGLALGEATVRAQEPQEQGEGEAQPAPETEGPPAPQPVSRDETMQGGAPAPRPGHAPAPTPVRPGVHPRSRPVIIRQQPVEIRPVFDPRQSAIMPAPMPGPVVPPAAPVLSPAYAEPPTSFAVTATAPPATSAPPPAAPGPVTPANVVPSAGLPGVPSRYAAKGLTEVEGGFTFSYVRLPGGSSATFALNPAVRRFVSDGLALGGTFELRVIKDGPKTFTIMPDAEYNFSFGDGRLYEFLMLGMGVRYVTSGGADATNFVFRPGLGTKLTFGGGLVGVALAVPIAFSDPIEIGLDIMTRYAVFF